jgi:hypothetical protein
MNVTERYVELLAGEGYRPKVDEDDATEIEFKVERVRFRMIVDPSDDQFVAISLAYRIEAGHAVEQLLAVANEMNRRIKVVKVLVQPDASAVRFSYETLVRGTLDPDLLERAISFLRGTSDEYFEEIRKAEPEATA